jgi:YbbR domain-containing protein
LGWLLHNLRYKLTALAFAALLWGVSHSTTSVERGFDVPVAIRGVPENLVVVAQSSDMVNIRVRGSRAALRSLTVGELEYPVQLAGSRPGVTELEVDTNLLDLPRGAQVVSRSPSNIDFTLERRGTKTVRVRADLEGDPAEGYRVAGVEIEPARVRITGARSEVQRLSEVLTETVDVTGAEAPFERAVRPSLRGRNVWVEEVGEIDVRVDVVPEAPAQPAPGDRPAAGRQG